MWGLLLFLSLRSKPLIQVRACTDSRALAAASSPREPGSLAISVFFVASLQTAVQFRARPDFRAWLPPVRRTSRARWPYLVFFVAALQTAYTIRQPLKSLLLRLMQGSARKPASPLRTFYLASFHETQSRRTSSVLKAFPLKKTHRPKPVRFCSEANGWFRTGTSRRIEVDAKSRSRQSGSGCW